MNSLIAYVDGSYNKKLHMCSYAAIILLDDEIVVKLSGLNENDFGHNNMRNVGGEILSALAAMEYAYDNKFDEIQIYYDYYGIEKWATGKWKTNNIYTKNYKEKYDHYSKNLSISFHKVKSHSNNEYNDMVDILAKKAALIEV